MVLEKNVQNIMDRKVMKKFLEQQTVNARSCADSGKDKQNLLVM